METSKITDGVNPEYLYTVDVIADRLGLTPLTIRRKCQDGKLKAVKHFGRWYIKGAWVIDHIIENGTDNSSS